jgi:hypothetical protein
MMAARLANVIPQEGAEPSLLHPHFSTDGEHYEDREPFEIPWDSPMWGMAAAAHLKWAARDYQLRVAVAALGAIS